MDNPPIGTIYGANITPYTLKDWSDEDIAKAIRYGIHKTGRSLKFMPSFDYLGLSIEDTAALVAYLRSVAPVTENSQENTFGPIAKVLNLLGQMPILFPAQALNLNEGFAMKPPEGPTREFGEYLAKACTGCHGVEFRGGKIPGGDPSWPEAANIRLGSLSKWNESLFYDTIKSGISPWTQQPYRAPMPIKLLQQMNETEMKAIWLFLSSLKE